jgi:hypothetical protein
MKVLCSLLCTVGLAGALATGAQGAPLPTPALKVLGITTPTHLPPEQSETQRVTIEAEGGSFKVQTATEGEGTPVFHSAHLALTANSAEATIVSIEAGAEFAVGDRVTATGLPEEEPKVVSCSPDCSSAGSVVTLSKEAVASEANVEATIYTNQVNLAKGNLHVGEAISTSWSGLPIQFFPEGTTVTAVAPGTITLSKPTGEIYSPFFGVIQFAGEPEETGPIGYNASAATLQAALRALPAIGADGVTVQGGPGGEIEHPYFLEFGGQLTDQNVAQVNVTTEELTGAHPFAHVLTTVQGGRGTGEIVAFPSNVGGVDSTEPTEVTIGPLPSGIEFSGEAEGSGYTCTGGVGSEKVSCTTEETIERLHYLPSTAHVPIEVEGRSAAPGTTVPVEISGGGSPQPDRYQTPIVVSGEPASYGLAAEFAGSYEADGSLSLQAGGHPFDSSAYFLVKTIRTATGAITVAGDPKDEIFDLPAGFIGNPLASKRCPQSTLLEPEHGSALCNQEMAVGNLDPFISSPDTSLNFRSRLYNDIPPKGFAAEFTTQLAFPLQSVVANVNSEEDFGIRLTAPNNANLYTIYGAFTAFEGVPKEGNGQALLTSPTNCAESAAKPPLVKGKADSYQEPGVYSEAFSIEQPALIGCDKLKFEGKNPTTGEGQVSFSFLPTSLTGSTPVGADAHLHIDQGGLTDPHGLATPELKRSVIKLPEGMSLNASSANGLEGCSEDQIGYKGGGYEMPNPIRFNEAQPACPDGSKLGTAQIKTPLLENPLVGEVFLANQEENPFGSLLAIYLVVNDPLTGVLIKLPGEVQTNPTTGRLTTVFENSPQLPFEDLELHFRGGGPRSEFATSEVCGDFPTEGEWTPWSAPESGPPAMTSDSFSVSSNCASSPGARPFSPSFEAGTTGGNAGGYNPLVIKIGRKDGEQELTSLDFTLPKGLIGKLAGIPYCGDAEIQAAEHKSGKQELSSSSCPAASQIGTVDTAAGVGSEPFHVGGKLYLAGPYKGAPVSSVVITPAVAGPLDLGDVVVRAPLYIDHETTVLTAKSDPIPTILRGIPLKIRSVNINVNRPGFILNPTNCSPMTVSSVLGGASGATANPTTKFAVEGCKNLKFAPKLKIQLKGKTKRAGNPALTATLTQPAGQANIGFVSVALPHSEFLEQGHIRTNCTRVQFAAEQCPKGSIYGHAEAVTPLLDQPLTGPVYLRSSSHKLPDLVAALKGPASQPIEVDLDGRIDSIHGGIRTTFETVPDAPVSKFVLRMQGGKKSLLVNSTNICKGKHKARIEMVGQNGKEHNFSQLVEPKCGKKKPKGKSKAGKKTAGKSKAGKKKGGKSKGGKK